MIISSVLILALILIDQIIKLISINLAPTSGSLIKVLIPEVLEFHHIVNTGASFGMFSGAQIIFSLITVVSLVLFGYFFITSDIKTKKVYTISIILFVAGTFGNAIDRIFRDGGVIDMLNMPILNEFLSLFGISPFIFNMADFYLTFAIILFGIDILFLERKRVDNNE